MATCFVAVLGLRLASHPPKTILPPSIGFGTKEERPGFPGRSSFMSSQGNGLSLFSGVISAKLRFSDDTGRGLFF